MKRAFSLFLLFFFVCSLPFSFAACGGKGGSSVHEHSFQTVFTYNADFHWYACEGGRCTEIKDKSAHVWDKGSLEDGGVVFHCTACQYKRKTDDLSGSVNEDEWKGMLLSSQFGNVTLKITEEKAEPLDGCFYSVTTLKVTDLEIRETLKCYGEADTLLSSIEKSAYGKDGKLMFSERVGDGAFTETDGAPDMTYDAYYNEYFTTLPRRLIDLSDLYDLFIYDAANGCYVSEDVEATATLDSGEIYTVYYNQLRVWFENGHLAQIAATSDEGSVTIVYSDYGATAIE